MALVSHYMNAWSPLPWLFGDGVDVGNSDYRKIVMTSGDDPYAERGLTPPPSQVFVRPATGDFNADTDPSIER